MSSSTVDLGVATIKTTVTSETSEINRLVKTFLSNKKNAKKIIGLDTERAQEESKQTKTVLLQLCDGDYCLIVQLEDDDDELPLSLFDFLNLPDFTFVGVGIKKSLKMLESEFGFTCKNAVDVGPASWNMTMATNKAAQVKYLMCDIFPTQKPTSPVFDEWDTSSLSKNQIKLAVSNAYLAFGVGNVLLSGFRVY